MIPLGSQTLFKVKARIREILPNWNGVLVEKSGKYLGFFVGPDAGMKSWDAPAEKWASRALQIKRTGGGLHFSVMMYNTTAVTSLSFVAQLVPAPSEVIKKGSSVLNSLAGCGRGALTPVCMHNLHLCGMPLGYLYYR